jgi:hypothetical protein
MLQRPRILECPHEGKHEGRSGFLDKVYPDGSAGIDLGFDRVCVADKWEKVHEEAVQSIASPAPKRRGRPPKNPKPIVPGPEVRSLLDESDGDSNSSNKLLKAAAKPVKLDSSPAAVETSTQSLTIERLADGRCNIEYRDGQAMLKASAITPKEITVIASMIQCLKTDGGAHEES